MEQCNSFSITYDPKKVKVLGSIEALILEQRLEELFKKHPHKFIKFISPCDSGLYIKGSSWTEELGISGKKFRTAFDKIGRRYDSKTAFEKEEDPFQGRRFCYYSNRRENKTVFVENMSVKSK